MKPRWTYRRKNLKFASRWALKLAEDVYEKLSISISSNLSLRNVYGNYEIDSTKYFYSFLSN